MTKFYLVRHGEPQWSLREQYQLEGSNIDYIPLTEKGIKEAKKVSQDRKLKKAQIIITSPYTRALQTAAILSKEIGIDLRVEFELREWEPKKNAVEGLEKPRDVVNLKGEGIVKRKGWIETKSLKSRILDVLDNYLEYDAVIVVSHEMIINTLVRSRDIDYCSITEFEIESKKEMNI